MQQKVSQLMGNGLLKQGCYEAAVKCFIAASDHEKIITCGNECLKSGKLKEGLQAYEALGRMIPPELLIACGDAIVEHNYGHGYCYAIKAYQMAGASSKLIAFGERILGEISSDNSRRDNEYYYGLVVEAFIASGSLEKILEIARCCYNGGFLELALKAYEVVRDRASLIELGDRYVRIGDYSHAAHSFSIASSWEKLIEVGDQLIKDGYEDKALGFYKQAIELYEQSKLVS